MELTDEQINAMKVLKDMCSKQMISSETCEGCIFGKNVFACRLENVPSVWEIPDNKDRPD